MIVRRTRERDARMGGARFTAIGILIIVAGLASSCSSPAPETKPDNRPRLDAFLDEAADGEPREGTYIGADGRPLGFIAYRSVAEPRRVALVYLHGIESHAGWFAAAAGLLQRQGYDVLCLDRRGSGINRENRGFESGYAESLDQLLEDVDLFVRSISHRYDHIVLTGLSWGGKLAVGYALTHPDQSPGIILITPGLRALVDVPLLTKVGVFAASVVRPKTRFATPIEPEMFTTTPEYLRYIKEDPLRLREVTARFLMISRELEQYIDENIAGNQLPIQLHLAGKDRIIDNRGVLEVLQRGAQSQLDVVLYPEQTHSIQFDAPEQMVAEMIRWLDNVLVVENVSGRQ